MPKNDKKGKAATAKTADDFDDMLAELRTADLINPATSRSPPTSSSSNRNRINSSIASSVLPFSGPAIGMNVSEMDMIQAAIRGNVRQLKSWARQGVRVRTAQPLREAAALGKVDVVQCFVKELGADVNLAAEDGCTPLYIAAQGGHTAMARCLVKELGAGVNKASHTGTTPLYIAAQREHLEVSCCLVKELGADVNIANKYGSTPLLKAIQEGHMHVTRSLIEDLGADINKATHDGRTPLMMASYHRHAKIVHLLTKHGADSQVSAAFGTAADISRRFGAPAALTEYLEAKTHCSNPGCSGAGIKKCTGCKQARYCGQACQLAHWPAHKAACKAHQAKGGKGK
jgi:ankyrin repeat protein